MNNEVYEIVVAVVLEINESLAVKLPANISGETVLFGDGSPLDSISLVSLIVAVEQSLQDKLGCSIFLVDERAMSRRSSPFNSVQSLVDYASQLVSEAQSR